MGHKIIKMVIKAMLVEMVQWVCLNVFSHVKVQRLAVQVWKVLSGFQNSQYFPTYYSLDLATVLNNAMYFQVPTTEGSVFPVVGELWIHSCQPLSGYFSCKEVPHSRSYAFPALPTASDWSIHEYKALATLSRHRTILKGKSSSKDLIRFLEVIVGPPSQFSFSLCLILFPSPNF